MGLGRDCAIGFSIATKGYIGTGRSYTGFYKKDFWEWDQATNVWTQKADFAGTARMKAIGFSIGTKGYIGTGYNNAYLQDFWEWDQATNTWTQKSNFGGAARDGAVSFSIGIKGYVGTGFNYYTNPQQHQDFWEWNQATDIWTQKANFGGTAREDAIGFSIGNKGYVGTGHTSFGYLKDFWEWNEVTNVWTQKSDFGGGVREAATGFSIGNEGYIGTGWGEKDFWAWNQITNIWTQKANFEGTARRHVVSFSIGNKGYIGTGYDENCIRVYDFWEYSPNEIGGVNELLQITMSIFPNPFSNQTAFSLSKEVKRAILTLFDISGKEVKNIKFSRDKITLQRENLSNGTYFYQISSENTTIATGKLIVVD